MGLCQKNAVNITMEFHFKNRGVKNVKPKITCGEIGYYKSSDIDPTLKELDELKELERWRDPEVEMPKESNDCWGYTEFCQVYKGKDYGHGYYCMVTKKWYVHFIGKSYDVFKTIDGWKPLPKLPEGK